MSDKKIAPEIVAAISAAVQAAFGNKVVAVRIKKSENWALAARGIR